MGVDTHMYLGPFFKVRSPKISEKIDRCRLPKVCPDSDGSAAKADPESYCSTCGSKSSDRFYESARRPNFYEMFQGDIFSDCRSNTGDSPLPDGDDFFIDCLIPNTYSELPPRFFYIGDTSDASQEIPDGTRGREIMWLRETFKPQLAELRKEFGIDNVQTEWGFLIWWT